MQATGYWSIMRGNISHVKQGECKMRLNFMTVLFVSLVLLISTGLTACGSTATSKGASSGAVVGGLVGGWRGAAIGALVGTGVGYAVDSADEKKQMAGIKERETAALESAAITNNPQTAYRPANNNPLVGSTWRVISLVHETENVPEFKSMVLTFQTNTKATTLILWADGRTESYVETYNVVGDALVFSGKDYVTNARYSVQNKQMVIVSPEMRVVLEELEESV